MRPPNTFDADPGWAYASVKGDGQPLRQRVYQAFKRGQAACRAGVPMQSKPTYASKDEGDAWTAGWLFESKEAGPPAA